MNDVPDEFSRPERLDRSQVRISKLLIGIVDHALVVLPFEDSAVAVFDPDRLSVRSEIVILHSFVPGPGRPTIPDRSFQ